jgi:UDP:flavonoid glycosyltransferase YjiC (YdhE family)
MTRILFTFAGGSGHADPLVPVARAVEAAGHTVAFYGRRSAAVLLEAHGFTLFVDPAEPARANSDPTTIAPLLELDMGREYRDLRDGFADRIARARAAGALELCGEWHPDLIVCDEVDFGCMIAAEHLGLPHATVLTNASGSFVRPDNVTPPLDALRDELGLPPDPGLAMPGRHVVLSPFAPRFRDPAFPLPPTAFSFRSDAGDLAEGGPGPPWLQRLADRPTIYVTLGTVFNMESGDLFGRVLRGVRDLPIEVVMTVGRQIDPASFGPQPDNVHIERYIPQSVLLPHCDVVLHHGGSGSVTGALAHGLPMVVLPMGADQPLNADRCERLGVGVTLDAVRVTPTGVGNTALTVMDGTRYRRAAEGLRDEIAALPEVVEAVPLLERLTRG